VSEQYIDSVMHSPTIKVTSTLSLCSSFNVREQISHPCKATGKIMVQYILICILCDMEQEDKGFWTKW